MRAIYWRLVPFLVFIILVLFLWRGLFLEPHTLPSAQLGRPITAFELPSLEDSKPFDSKQLQGQVVLLNVWASWCAACIEEQVFLMSLSREGLIPIYGLNYKDKSSKARQWLAEWGNPYVAVAEDRQGKVAIDLGVYGAPETFLIDKQGRIRYRQVGILTETIWQEKLLPLIKQLQGEL